MTAATKAKIAANMNFFLRALVWINSTLIKLFEHFDKLLKEELLDFFVRLQD